VHQVGLILQAIGVIRENTRSVRVPTPNVTDAVSANLVVAVENVHTHSITVFSGVGVDNIVIYGDGITA
jgi:hypothetical protein